MTRKQKLDVVRRRTAEGAYAYEIAAEIGMSPSAVEAMRRELRRTGLMHGNAKRGYRAVTKVASNVGDDRPLRCIDVRGRDKLLEALRRVYA